MDRNSGGLFDKIVKARLPSTNNERRYICFYLIGAIKRLVRLVGSFFYSLKTRQTMIDTSVVQRWLSVTEMQPFFHKKDACPGSSQVDEQVFIAFYGEWYEMCVTERLVRVQDCNFAWVVENYSCIKLLQNTEKRKSIIWLCGYVLQSDELYMCNPYLKKKAMLGLYLGEFFCH